MDNDPLAGVYSIVERTYVRLQAGDLLIRCLDEGEITPIQQMVEGLVLAGPPSLDALREVLEEANARKDQVRNDMHQLLGELEENLKSYGIKLRLNTSTSSLSDLSQLGLFQLLREQHIEDHETQKICLQILKDGRELFESLSSRIKLLEDIESFLNDWLWGVAYQSVHSEDNHSKSAS